MAQEQPLAPASDDALRRAKLVRTVRASAIPAARGRWRPPKTNSLREFVLEIRQPDPGADGGGQH